ncbi:hypothetical protein [Bradyrhizobium betae]|uniref:Uncharacterized protein n=1 Tax=Bradyrhizobium betae TaxID=244734 RepID=A0A5P6NZ71_9BRAD|nr:hypothetical protein [Bradyrhizobium betae]MCS3725347.1 hypothetical protein [Bradyrhizobium betae]QFI71340.1 hypothetical protein F8237_02505 [Bradyrhizobium betae]
MIQNRGCFDRSEDETDAEYASSPCYMHGVDLSYFGLKPSTCLVSDPDLNTLDISASTSRYVHSQRDAVVVWIGLRTLLRALSQTIGREAAAQIEGMEARRKIRALARLRARTTSKR